MPVDDPLRNRPQENSAADNAADQDLVRFYRDTIMRHSVAPVGYRVAIAATHSAEQYNPLCGDRIRLSFAVVDEHIRQAAFDGEACAMCLASASLLCEGAPGGTIGELQERMQWLEHSLNSDTAASSPPPPSLVPLLGVKQFPSRVKCVMLPWIAASDALTKCPVPQIR